jgi:Uma2 family endonuclease
MKSDVDIFGKKELSPVAVLLNLSALKSERSLTREEYLSVCERFPNLHIEREKDGKITVMSPVLKGSGRREISLLRYLIIWLEKHQAGEIFGPSSGFDLPDGSTKQPDAAWISPERLAGAESDDEDDFIKTVPDFVGEVRSSSDSIAQLR